MALLTWCGGGFRIVYAHAHAHALALALALAHALALARNTCLRTPVQMHNALNPGPSSLTQTPKSRI